MAVGPGKYDELATFCMEQTKAQAVVLIVIGGIHGHGMSGKEQPLDFEIAMKPIRTLHRMIPLILREVANNIEAAPEDAFDV